MDQTPRSGAADRAGAPAARRHPLVVALVAAVALEVGLLAGVAGYFVVGILGGRAANLGAAVTTAVLALLLAAALAVFTRALWHGRRWARAPIMTWNLLVVFSLLSTGAWRNGAGLAVLLVSVGVAVAMLTPPVVRATTVPTDPPVT